MASTSCQLPSQISQEGADVFRKAVRYILTEWPSLDLAIENGMGGSQALEKRDWICSTIADVVLKNKDIDLEEYLAAMIDQEFDTLVEDGSLEYNVKWIEKFHKDCLQGKEQDVQAAIQQASQKKLSLGNMKIPPPICQTQESDDEDSEGSDEEGDGDYDMKDS